MVRVSSSAESNLLKRLSSGGLLWLQHAHRLARDHVLALLGGALEPALAPVLGHARLPVLVDSAPQLPSPATVLWPGSSAPALQPARLRSRWEPVCSDVPAALHVPVHIHGLSPMQ